VPVSSPPETQVHQRWACIRNKNKLRTQGRNQTAPIGHILIHIKLQTKNMEDGIAEKIK
jgi:hypothetical protein